MPRINELIVFFFFGLRIWKVLLVSTLLTITLRTGLSVADHPLGWWQLVLTWVAITYIAILVSYVGWWTLGPVVAGSLPIALAISGLLAINSLFKWSINLGPTLTFVVWFSLVTILFLFWNFARVHMRG